MNPAALATNLADLEPGGILIVNEDAFDEKGLDQAGYTTNPLDDGSLDGYQLFPVEMTKLTRLAVEGLGLSQKEADRCRNFFAMGLVFWLYDRSLEPTLRYIDEKFGKKPAVAEANRRALQGRLQLRRNDRGHSPASITVDKADLPPGTYRNMTGNQATGLGPDRRRQAQRQRAVLRQLSDHAGQRHSARAGAAQELRRAHVPGRGRDRRHDLGHRRRLRRRHGRHRLQRPGHRAEGRGASAWP